MNKYSIHRFSFIFLLISGFLVSSCSILKTQSLETAVKYSNPKEVRRHLNEGEDPNKKNEAGETFLHQAAQVGHMEVAEILIERGAKVNATDNEGRTPLHHAAKGGHTKVTELLIAKQAKVDSRDNNGRTPLHHAALQFRPEVVEILLDKGAKVDARDKQGMTPLYVASLSNSNLVASRLISSGAEVNPAKGPFPLMGAAREGNLLVARILLENKAQVEGPPGAPKTPLHLAADKGILDMVRLLLEHGAKPDGRDRAGNTPLYYSTYRDHVRIMDELLRHDANVNQKVPEGTLLHIVAEKGFTRAASILIQKGAHLEKLNAKGKKPLDVAIHKGNRRVADLILHETINQREVDK